MVKQWPKVELHRHLEGALRVDTLLDLFQKNHGRHEGISTDELKPLVQLTGEEQSFFDWIPIFDYFMPAIQTQDDLKRITIEAVQDAASDGICYLELRYAPFFIAHYNDLAPEAIVEAVQEGLRLAQQNVDLPTELILIAQQSGGEAEAKRIVELAQAYDHRGVDMAGDMRKLPLDIYAPIFTEARESGLGITIHAGEVAPPESVWVAVTQLHATRIGHGIRSIEDKKLLEMLVERGILLEVCVSSNAQTHVVPSTAEHPIRELMREGVSVCVNSDDPGLQAITLTDEYNLLMREHGFTPQDFWMTNFEASVNAFTNDEVKANIQQTLEAGYSGLV